MLIKIHNCDYKDAFESQHYAGGDVTMANKNPLLRAYAI